MSESDKVYVCVHAHEQAFALVHESIVCVVSGGVCVCGGGVVGACPCTMCVCGGIAALVHAMPCYGSCGIYLAYANRPHHVLL